MHCNVSEGAITIYLVILEHGVVAVLRWLCINSHGDCLIWFLEPFQVEWHSPVCSLTLQCPPSPKEGLWGVRKSCGGSCDLGISCFMLSRWFWNHWTADAHSGVVLRPLQQYESQAKLILKNLTSWYLLCWSFKICTKTPSSHLPIIKISAKYKVFINLLQQI